jgi:hypothetical protein
MPRDEVRSVMAATPRFARPTRDDFEPLGVNYDADGRAAEFCLFPDRVRVSLDGVVLLGPGAVADVVSALLARDPEPWEHVGFMIFPGLGVNITGFHDGDCSQLAFNVFRRGLWDSALADARKVAAAELRPSHA